MDAPPQPSASRKPTRARGKAGGPRETRTEGLVKAYSGRRVVDDVSLHIQEGEVVGLLGPNGAGKTTSFYCILGLERPDEGRVLLNGEDVTDLPIYLRARLGLSYLPQEASAFRRLSVADNLRAILQIRNLPRDTREQRLQVLLDEFGLTHLADRKAYSLSGGERRRTEIARALVMEPSFLLLDEPFAGIDPIAVLEIQGMVARLAESGIGILITDHNVRDTLRITHRAYIIKEGRIFREGPPEELAADEDVRKSYLGETFEL